MKGKENGTDRTSQLLGAGQEETKVRQKKKGYTFRGGALCCAAPWRQEEETSPADRSARRPAFRGKAKISRLAFVWQHFVVSGTLIGVATCPVPRKDLLRFLEPAKVDGRRRPTKTRRAKSGLL